MIVEIGANLYHTALFFTLIWGITRFFAVLGKVAEGQRRLKPPVQPIKFTR